jgi:ABC transporter DrrB family efflux protein
VSTRLSGEVPRLPPVVSVALAPPKRTPLRWVISDAVAMTWRNLLKYVRVPQLLVFSTIQPVMFVLLFVYVFGGAIQGSTAVAVQYLIPGILIQTLVFGAQQTGVGLAEDLQKGIVDRFRSLPMSRSAVLAGRTLSDTVRNLFVALLMLAVGGIIGFRPQAGLFAAAAGVGLGVLFGLAFSWISATIGMAVKDAESAQTSSFLWVFPLVFASSSFVEVSTMPGWLQAFAKINPITSAVDALRALMLGGETQTAVLRTLAWIAGILLVFIPLSVHRYRKAS